MSRICSVTGKRRVSGSRIHRKGLTKKSGGIGTHIAKITKRTFKPNVQRVRVRMANGQIKRVWVSAKALKAGLVEKA
jgi:large subunit ribosomal protein L28